MSASDDSVPEPIVEKPTDATGELASLAPAEALRVTTEIRAVAESRGESSELVELMERAQSGRFPRAGSLPSEAEQAAADDEQLTPDELRDAWPLLDLDERADGLRVLPREDAEEFFVALSAADQAALLLHFRSGQRRQWM